MRWGRGGIGFCLAVSLFAQDTDIRTTVRLVAISTSVTDRNGQPVLGLSESDFTVTDDGRPQAFHVTSSLDASAPIAIAVVVQTSDVTSAAMAKIEKVGAMIPDAVAGANAAVAVITYDDHVHVVKNFTSDPGELSTVFRGLKSNDVKQARMTDAVSLAIQLLQMRPDAQRASILVMGETRDRGSECELGDVLDRAQRAGITIYGTNYSGFWTPFTARPEDYQAANGGNPDILRAITETARLAKTNTMQALVAATGGRRFNFLTQSHLESDLLGLGKDIHSRYLITFTPGANVEAGFHRVTVTVKKRTRVIVSATPGYWFDSGMDR